MTLRLFRDMVILIRPFSEDGHRGAGDVVGDRDLTSPTFEPGEFDVVRD